MEAASIGIAASTPLVTTNQKTAGDWPGYRSLAVEIKEESVIGKNT